MRIKHALKNTCFVGKENISFTSVTRCFSWVKQRTRQLKASKEWHLLLWSFEDGCKSAKEWRRLTHFETRQIVESKHVARIS